MGFVIELPDALFTRLRRASSPLVDTPITVIERAINALEAGDEDAAAEPAGKRTFNPAAPPNLSFTTLLSAAVDGKALAKSDTYWNSLLMAVILAATHRGTSTRDILDLIYVNCQEGRRDNGFHYVEAAGLSIQGQAAQSAWKQAYSLASSFGIEVEAEFIWQGNAKAAQPGVHGSFFVEGGGK